MHKLVPILIIKGKAYSIEKNGIFLPFYFFKFLNFKKTEM